MPTLYEIAPAHRALADKLRDMGVDEETIVDTLEGESDLPAKVETYCIVMREKEADIEAFKREKERFEDKIKSAESTIKRLKGMLLYGLQTAGETRVQAGSFVVAIQKAKASVNVVHPELLPKDYMTSPVAPEPQPDKALIYTALTEGHKVPGCELKPGVRLAIK